ncbi:hypothetical protein PR048_011042 [Dryococelus australis]|uniref:Uncharacterized protein n=1 Tax=Dryococelus australis TaxID=614101 RepID=A0ABQ9HKI4_9NEOP|nr:hypothetical protein PR048_011042 [Dryococelus australis]
MNTAVDHSEVVPVLGVLGSRVSDSISVNAGITEIEPEPLTKTKILSAAHKLFNPIGFTVFVILIPKLLMQCITKENAKLAFHTFCDACQYAYATVVFLRVELTLDIKLHLVEAKARWLELLAATIATRLASKTAYSLGIDVSDIHFGVIQQLKKKITGFVYYRVQEIRQLSNKKSWRRVVGTLNPADLTSRGCSADVLFQLKW